VNATAERGDLLDTPAAGPAAIRGGVLRIAGYVAGLVLSVGSAALLFRHLGVDDTGRYVTVLSLVTIAGGLTDAGLLNIGVREFAVRRGLDRDRLMRSLLALRLVLTGAGIAGAVGFAALAGYGGASTLGTLFAGLGMLILGLQNMATIPLTTDLRLGTVAAVDFVRQVVTVALILGLVAAGAGLLSFLAIPTLAAAVVVLLITLPLVRGRMPRRPSFERAGVVGLLRDTAAYAAATAVNTLYVRMTIILLSLTATAKETGYFSASFRIVEVLTVLPILAVGAAFPILARAARDDHTRFSYAIQRTWEVSLIAGAWIAVTLGLGAPLFIDIVAGSSFGPSVDVLRIQAVAMVGLFCAYAASYGLLSIHRYRDLLWITLLGLAANVALTLALSDPLGARGAAIAASTTEVLLATASAWLLIRAPGGVRLSLRALPRVAAAAGLAVAVAATGLPSAALVVLGTVVFFGALLLLGGIPDEMVDEVRRLRGRWRPAGSSSS
jgi:O-antigen/teichoic acid export membrane protein